MVKPTGPSNVITQAIIQLLDKADQAPIWRRIAKDLSSPRRSQKSINLDQINRLVNENEKIVVASKILATGVLTKKLTIGALNFSDEARRKIQTSGSKAFSILELWEKFPKGSNIRIIK